MDLFSLYVFFSVFGNVSDNFDKFEKYQREAILELKSCWMTLLDWDIYFFTCEGRAEKQSLLQAPYTLHSECLININEGLRGKTITPSQKKRKKRII